MLIANGWPAMEAGENIWVAPDDSALPPLLGVGDNDGLDGLGDANDAASDRRGDHACSAPESSSEASSLDSVQ